MRLDPRTKLLILAVTSVSVFMNKSIAVECVLAGIPLVLVDTVAEFVAALPLADIRIFAYSLLFAVFILYFICSNFLSHSSSSALCFAVSSSQIFACISKNIHTTIKAKNVIM